MEPTTATARACANVALVKYWGKRDEALNLPAVGSISLTLDGLEARATVGPAVGGTARFVQDGRAVGGTPGDRMAAFLDLLGETFAVRRPLVADVRANFPVAAGLASSAAIHCAVAAAAASACGARIDLAGLSALARRGSGSAARSVHGGLVEWRRGERDDGADSIAVPLLPEGAWDLAMAVAVVSEARKEIGSRDAMRHVAETSPLYPGWIAAQEEDLAAARAAIAARDLAALGRIAEENCLRMHASAIAARPPVLYWRPATLEAMATVGGLRTRGIGAWFTMDAGPQVKVLCAAADLDAVAAALAAVPGVVRVLRAPSGPGVAVEDGEVPWS